MISDRSYMQNRYFGGESELLKWLLVGNVAIFAPQAIFEQFMQSSFWTHAFAFSGLALQEGFIWTVATYAFLHGNLFHLLVNCLVIYFIGKPVLSMVGVRKFSYIYAVSAVLGALAWLTLHMGESTPLVGASAAALGLLAYFCLMMPEQPVTVLLFFILPITVKPKWLLWVVLGVELFGLVLEEIPGRGNIANSAHLGGMLAGFLCFQVFEKKMLAGAVSLKKPAWSEKKQKSGHFEVNVSERSALKEEVDRILDKINAHGFGALSKNERDTLDKAKDILRN